MLIKLNVQSWALTVSLITKTWLDKAKNHEEQSQVSKVGGSL